jgi:hypothetical protein
MVVLCFLGVVHVNAEEKGCAEQLSPLLSILIFLGILLISASVP